MSVPRGEIVLVALVAGLALALLTLIGERMRDRVGRERSDPAVEMFNTRVDSWWIMVVLFTLALLIGPSAVVVLFAFASFAALREFYTFTDKSRADHLSLALAFYVVLPVQFLVVWLDRSAWFSLFVPVAVFLALPIVTALRGDVSRFLARVSETQWGLMICVFSLSHIPALIWLDPGGGRGMLLVVFLVVVVQSADLAEVFLGRRFARRPLVEGLSHRTVEGAVVALVAAALLGLALSALTPFGAVPAMALAVLASLAGQGGYLVLKAIRRDRGLRDWSHLIPGQGGFLNQLDSVIFAAPVFYYAARAMLAP